MPHYHRAKWLSLRKRWLGFLAVAVLIAWVAWDIISPVDAYQDCGGPVRDLARCPASYSALHSVAAGTLQALLIIGAAWLFFDDRRAKTEELVADSTTSIALAGSVVPLLEVAWVLSWLGTPVAMKFPFRPRFASSGVIVSSGA